MKKIAIAGFQHETNTFSPIKTTERNFENGGINANGILKGEEIFYFQTEEMNNATSGFMRVANSLDMHCIPLVWMEAEPSGNIDGASFLALLQTLENAALEQMPFDGLFLDLHGAMIYGDHQDGETEILRRMRQLVGDIPIVAALDLHGNISEESFDLASVLIGYRTYPHIDIYETGKRCAQIMSYMLQGNPIHKSFRQLPFLIPTSSQNTFKEPLLTVFDSLGKLEKEGSLLSASVMLGFPPADIWHCGPSIFTYAEDKKDADQALESLYLALMEHEDAFKPSLTSIDEAMQRVRLWVHSSHGNPLILADVQDNPGGGSGSDTVWLLQALLEAGITNAAIALLYDPEAANAAHLAGEGADITIDLGGKMLPGQKPFSGTFKVIKLLEGDVVGTGPMSKGMVINLGKMALLEIQGIFISVSSARIQAADQAVFTVFGLDPKVMDVIVLKSFVHFRAAFEEIAGEIIEVEAPGAEFDDPSKVEYTHLRDGVRLFGNGPVHKRVSN